MKNYAIFYFRETENGYVKYFLQNLNGDYGPNTNFTFETAQCAVRFLKTYDKTPIATRMLISGPKGGVYSGFTGR